MRIKISFYVLAKLIPSLSASTPACITTIRPSMIKLIDCDGSIIDKLFSIFSTQKWKIDTLLQNAVTLLNQK